MKEIIKQKLDEYLEFDSDKLFRYTDLVRVFGGAIRDIIADQPIHDIDILIGSRSIQILETFIQSEGYHYMDGLIPKDLSSIYTNIRVINEPRTWVKNGKIIQLIKPATSSQKLFSRDQRTKNHSIIDSYYKSSFANLISNVDLSCCGVSYDGKDLYENFPYAITHCKNKIFSVNKNAMMYNPDRITHRCQKMILDRGWTQFDDSKSMERDIKISNLIDNDISRISYVIEYKPNYPTDISHPLDEDNFDFNFNFI